MKAASESSGSATARFGHTELPEEQHAALGKAKKFEWITIAFLTVSTAMIYLVLGNSQALKAAWIEDVLSLLPPISFLVAARIIRKRPSEEHPYGFHRAVGIAHVVASVALVVMACTSSWTRALDSSPRNTPLSGASTSLARPSGWAGS